MLRLSKAIVVIVLVGLASVTAAEAQTPTFSLEAVAVNGAPLPAPTDRLRIGPGERVTAKVFLRDWSPKGEVLRAYQAELNPDTFNSGTAGWIKPVGFDEKRANAQENPTAAFINEKDPQYVHSGLRIIPITDTLNAPGYRWLTVLLYPEEEAPAAKQDGKKYYLGTGEYEASADAAGIFKLGFVEDPSTTGLLDLSSVSIEPVKYEPLTLEVQADAVRLFIKKSEPPHRTIDARRATADGGRRGGWDTIRLSFSADPKGLSAGDFIVTDASEQPPAVRGISVEGASVTLSLSTALRVGSWTTITYVPTGSRVSLGCLPGDVNNDGEISRQDLISLVDLLNQKDAAPLYLTDINRDNHPTSADLLALLDLVTPARLRGATRMNTAP